jgi:hypothetical protein
MGSDAEVRTRRIRLASVYHPYYVRIQNCGFPGGYRIAWRGKRDFAQPGDALKWNDVLALLAHRLALAGLRWVEPPQCPPEFVETPIVVDVVRLGRKLRKRAYDWEPRPEGGRCEMEDDRENQNTGAGASVHVPE